MIWAGNRKKWTPSGGRCISVCPWNEPLNIYHNVIRSQAVRIPVGGKSMLVRMDRLMYPRKRSIVQ